MHRLMISLAILCRRERRYTTAHNDVVNVCACSTVQVLQVLCRLVLHGSGLGIDSRAAAAVGSHGTTGPFQKQCHLPGWYTGWHESGCTGCTHASAADQVAIDPMTCNDQNTPRYMGDGVNELFARGHFAVHSHGIWGRRNHGPSHQCALPHAG